MVHEEVIVCKRAGTSYTLARLNRTHVRTQPQPWYYLVALLGCLPVLRFMHARLGYRAKGTAKPRNRLNQCASVPSSQGGPCMGR